MATKSIHLLINRRAEMHAANKTINGKIINLYVYGLAYTRTITFKPL